MELFNETSLDRDAGKNSILLIDDAVVQLNFSDNNDGDIIKSIENTLQKACRVPTE